MNNRPQPSSPASIADGMNLTAEERRLAHQEFTRLMDELQKSDCIHRAYASRVDTRAISAAYAMALCALEQVYWDLAEKRLPPRPTEGSVSKEESIMPLHCHPAARAFFALSSDAHLPLSQRPEFIVRKMSDADFAEHARLITLAYAENDDGKCFHLLNDAAKIGIIGWRNMRTSNPMVLERFGLQPKGEELIELPFSPEKTLAPIVSDREVWELVRGYPEIVRLRPRDASFYK